MAPIPLVDNPQFWIAFGLAETALPIMIPNKRWMGAAMLAMALLFYASAAGWLPDAWIPEPWRRRDLAIVTLTLAIVLLSAAVAVWLARRPRRQRSRMPVVTIEVPESVPPMSDHITVVSNPADRNPEHDYFELTTNNQSARLIETKQQVTKLRFIIPTEQEVKELPAYLPVGKGQIIIKAFTTSGIRIEERGTRGDTIRAEIYYRENLISNVARSERQPLTIAQRDSLISQLRPLGFCRLGILREPLSDLVYLADQLHSLFQSLGWQAVFSPGNKSFEEVPPGLRIRYKPDDIAAKEVCRILGGIWGELGVDIEKTKNMDWFEIEIGRMPL